jgi:hypothetical protein
MGRGGPPMTDWTQDDMGAWTRTLYGMLLRVTADPDDPDDPWTWEVLVQQDDDTEYEVDLGGATTREEAMAAAEAKAEDNARGR